MKHIPRILNCATVKLFAVRDLSGRTTTQPAISQVAICQRNEPPLFAVYFCDALWQTLDRHLCENIEMALSHAQETYPELTERWLTPQAAVSLRENQPLKLVCAFCCHEFMCEGNMITGEKASICYRCLDKLYHERYGGMRKVRTSINTDLRKDLIEASRRHHSPRGYA